MGEEIRTTSGQFRERRLLWAQARLLLDLEDEIGIVTPARDEVAECLRRIVDDE